MTSIVPGGLTSVVFRALYPEFDLVAWADGTTMAIPKDGSIPVFTGSTLSEITFQIANYRGKR
jgi:hypothetical protein